MFSVTQTVMFADLHRLEHMTEKNLLDHITQNCLPGFRKTKGTSLGIPTREIDHQGSAPPKSSKFSSVAQSCPTRCNPMDCSMPGLPVHHQSLLKLVSIESVMPSNHLILCHPLLLLPFNLSQHQGLFRSSKAPWQITDYLGLNLPLGVTLNNQE